jgi:hypothetical protein
MNKQAFLQIQTLELQHLLESAGDDPILAPQLRERLEDAQRELDEIRRQQGTLIPKEPVVLPRAAIFLQGDGVPDSEGIRPPLAGEAMIQYEKMFTEQALHDEREAARKAGRHRRRRGTPTPALLFTGTPRGSFGLEFVPQVTEEDSLEIHAQSLRHVADALVLVAESESRALDDAVNKIPARVLQPLKSFMGTLARHGAEIRLAFPDRPPRSLNVEQVRTAAERLDKEVIQEPETIRGTFRGVTLETGKFDLRTETGEVITGTVADDLTEDELERIALLTNHACIADLQKTTVSKIGGAPTPTYVLLNAQPAPAVEYSSPPVVPRVQSS